MSRLAEKLKQLGMEPAPQQSGKKTVTFCIFFPRPPYGKVRSGPTPTCPHTDMIPAAGMSQAKFRAAKVKEGGYNFAGLLLGHGGHNLQRIQKATGTKIEIQSEGGNLNGQHPSGEQAEAQGSHRSRGGGDCGSRGAEPYLLAQGTIPPCTP